MFHDDCTVVMVVRGRSGGGAGSILGPESVARPPAAETEGEDEGVPDRSETQGGEVAWSKPATSTKQRSNAVGARLLGI